jgi:7,8-dihydropterin-6-yl-methyl-4-(beta-D-ribofuranosyl)aminobenzene 5'-phosphate synthase
MGEGLDRLTVTVLAEDTVGYEKSLLGQHGLSLLLEAELEGEKRTVLMDVGQNHKALRFNMDELGVDPLTIDAVVLTHCHYDHTGGLAEMVRSIGKPGLPVIGHPGTFRPHFVTRPFLRHVGVRPEDSREHLEEAGACLYLTRDPFFLMPGLRTTGEVPRQTGFEEPGIALSTIEDGAVIEDQVLDDISVIAGLRERGLVVLTGCSHAGIVNITRHAQTLTGITRLEGILGGFHLVEAGAQRIEKTVEALQDLAPGRIAAGHCTGFQAQAALHRSFGDRFTPLHSGMRVVW